MFAFENIFRSMDAFTRFSGQASGSRPDDPIQFTRGSDSVPSHDPSGSVVPREDARRISFRYRVVPPVGFDYVSDAMTRATGHSAGDFYADPQLLLRITAPEQRWMVTSMLSDSPDVRVPASLRWMGANADYLTVDLSLRQIKNEDGAIVAIDVYAREVAADRGAAGGTEDASARLRLALDLSQDAIGILRPVRDRAHAIVDFRWEYANPAADELIGGKPRDLAGMTVSQTLAQPGSRKLIEVLSNVMVAGPGEMQSHVQLLDTMLSIRASKHDDGVVIVLARQPDQDRAVMEQSLARSISDVLDESRGFREQINELCDLLLETGADFAIVLLDEVVTGERLGIFRARKNFVGRAKLAEAVSHWNEERVQSKLSTNERSSDTDIEVLGLSHDRVRAQERAQQETFDRIQRAQPSSLYALPLIGADDEIGTVIFGSSRDSAPIDPDKVRLAKSIVRPVAWLIENAELREEIRSASEMREEFMSMVAHEIKTPLTGIRGYGQLIERFLYRDDPDLERARRAVRGLQTQIERFRILAGDLFDATRVHQGRLDLRLEVASLRSIALDAVERVQALSPSMGRTIVVDISEPLSGMWDAVRMDQVLYILLSNAVNYSLDGEIRLAGWREGDRVFISVSDQGIGIQQGDVENLFEPFGRGHRAHSLANGSGLGLYLAREIIRQHDGQIAIRSQPEVGTTVTIQLPIRTGASQRSAGG